MFGYKYKLSIVNADKQIVKFTPTIGTYAKAFAAPIVGAVVFTALAGLASKKTKMEEKTLDESADETLAVVKD